MRPSMRAVRSRRARAALGAVFLVALLSASAVGTVPAPFAQQQQPTFRTGVEVVAIDVTIVDAQARPVEGLKPEDFIVTVDRKPRRIASAQYVNHGVRLTQPAGGRSSGSTSRSGSDRSVLDTVAAAPPPARTGRNVMIVIDTDSMEIPSGQNAIRAIRAFLDELPATDRVGVATIPRLPSSLTFAADRTVARKALDQIVTAPADMPAGEHSVGLQEAYDMENKDQTAITSAVARECRCVYTPATGGAAGTSTGSTGSDGPGGLAPCSTIQMEECVVPLLMFAHQTALAGHMQAQQSLEALQDLGRGLARIEGPKTVVLVTGGLGVPETATSFDPLEPALAAGQVTLYTLYMEQAAMGQVRRPLSPTFVADERMPLYGIDNVTAAANGTLIQVVGKVESAFERVATEMSGSYLLGIEVEPADRDGRPHAVNVKVNRSGVEVRARKRYVIQPEKPGVRPAEPAPPPLSAAGRAARRAERTAPMAAGIDDVTPELVAVMARAGEFVLDYGPRIHSLASDEQYDQTLSKWKSNPVVAGGVSQAREDWFVDKRRSMKSDYLLLRGTGPFGWLQFRDPFEVDGRAVHSRTGGLEKLFAGNPANAVPQAQQLMAESTRYNLGFGARNMDVPTLVLFLLEPVNRERFFFKKEAETQVEGTPTWQVAFFERGTPTIFAAGENGNLPLEGTIWIEPTQGRIVKSTVRLNTNDADAEITVTYRPSSDLGGLWVPSEVRETYTSDTQKLDCVGRYSNFRLLKGQPE